MRSTLKYLTEKDFLVFETIFQMFWFQCSHVRMKNKVIQETYTRDSCFEVITFYWIQSENVVWLANSTLGFEITVLPICSNQ